MPLRSATWRDSSASARKPSSSNSAIARALVGRHLRDQLLQPELERLREALLDQHAAEPLAAPGRRDQHAQLADVPGPAQLVGEDRGAADHRRAVARDQARQLAAVERPDPGVDDLRMADVARQEQQVVRRQRRDERDQRIAVGGGHPRDLDRRAAAFDLPGIASRRLAHVERASSHASSAGHMRFTAFGPAAMLTWPPGSVISLLSFEPTAAPAVRCRRAARCGRIARRCAGTAR